MFRYAPIVFSEIMQHRSINWNFLTFLYSVQEFSDFGNDAIIVAVVFIPSAKFAVAVYAITLVWFAALLNETLQEIKRHNCDCGEFADIAR